MGFETLRQLLQKQVNESRSIEPEKPVVMIIDDDQHLLDDLAFALKDNYLTTCCSTGAQGLQQIDETVFAVVLDIKMPDLDGFQVFKAIKERFLHLPVLFHSAYQDLKDPYEVMNQYRPFGYISKSADLSQLRDSIASAVAYYTQICRNQDLVKELQLTKNFLDNIINSMPSILLGLDPEKKVIHWNRKAEEKTGISAGEAIGQQVEKVFPKIAEQMETIYQAMNNRTPQKTEKLMEQEGEKARYSDILCYPLVNNGVEGVILRIDDVTERVMLGEMMVKADKMVTISGLSAGIAHEINNPLSVISQYTQIVRQRFQPDLRANISAAETHGIDLSKVNAYMQERKIFDCFDHIIEASLRSSEIVQNMLNFSRRGERVLSPVDIHRLIEEILHLAANEYSLKKQNRFRSIEIQRHYAADLPRIPCVRMEIGQVLLNLLRNAAQAIGSGTVDAPPKITITTEQKQESAAITIADNGPGITEEIRQHIFEPFFTTKQEGHGTGLGLSVSYHIITEHHHGDLYVVSQAGEGAAFTMLLPLSATTPAD